MPMGCAGGSQGSLRQPMQCASPHRQRGMAHSQPFRARKDLFRQTPIIGGILQPECLLCGWRGAQRLSRKRLSRNWPPCRLVLSGGFSAMAGRPPHRRLISNLFQPLPRKLWPLHAPSNQPCLLGCSEPAVEPIQGGDPPIRSEAGLRQQGTGFLIQQKGDHGGQQASTPRRRHTACPVLQVDF